MDQGPDSIDPPETVPPDTEGLPATESLNVAPPTWPMIDAPAPPSGWTLPVGPGSAVPPPPPTRGRRILEVALWIAGLAALAILTVVWFGRDRSSSGSSDSYVAGYVAAQLVISIAIGAGAIFLFRVVQRRNGNTRPSWAWALVIASVVYIVVGRPPASTASSAPAVSPSPGSYSRVVSPYVTSPTTSADTTFVDTLRSQAVANGFTLDSAARIVGPDGKLDAFLVVYDATDTSSDPAAAVSGAVDELTKESVSPTVTSVDGRSVIMANVGQNWEAAWFDGSFYALVIAGDQASASAIAKAVLDAH